MLLSSSFARSFFLSHCFPSRCSINLTVASRVLGLVSVMCSLGLIYSQQQQQQQLELIFQQQSQANQMCTRNVRELKWQLQFPKWDFPVSFCSLVFSTFLWTLTRGGDTAGQQQQQHPTVRYFSLLSCWCFLFAGNNGSSSSNNNRM